MLFKNAWTEILEFCIKDFHITFKTKKATITTCYSGYFYVN
ncbi:hypothetical protein D778_00243 [Xanthomarina gelatinilytica]|uniref:Uncharacterized protein n=1 Tax=Xanthomarina gelatinilytica TaxID=1137281 RepID=M7N8U5_9FLAO|nr:hypothetical protein D778_00243 [Xanthomarina gelatinilytica]